jgi:hypothetical protein
MTPKEKDEEKKPEMSQYNASFNLYYDVILQQLASYFFNNDIIDSDSKYGLAHYSILRTLFDYVDEVVKDYPYTSEQLVSLIEEHDTLKTKFEQKLLSLAGDADEKMLKVMSEIESE